MVDDVKAHNESIASDYSNLVYDPILAAFVDPDRVFGQAAMFGEVGRPVDVLDLACGTGAQLLRVAEKVSGRLVGVDISPGPIRIAQERLAPYGSRADVRCADLLETDAASLGQFDLIYNIGVIYATPPAVQRRILDLIGQCLRPGGVALISWHSGGAPALRSVLHRILVAGLEGLSPDQSVAAARSRSAKLRENLTATPGSDLLLAALTARLPPISPTSPQASIAMQFSRATSNPGCVRSPTPGSAGLRCFSAITPGSSPASRISPALTSRPAPRSGCRHRWQCSIAWQDRRRLIGRSWSSGQPWP